MKDILICSQKEKISYETLVEVLGKMLDVKVIDVTYDVEVLQGGTIADVKLIWGSAQTENQEDIPYKVVLKVQKKWERYGDPGSWRREYDLYSAGVDKLFLNNVRYPKCYRAQLKGDEVELWIEYIDGVSGLDMTVDMYETAATELGRIQGMLYAKKPKVLHSISNLSDLDFTKNFYLHYRSWPEVYDYIRSDDCEVPKHICDMLIHIDENSDSIWERIESLPKVLCHRDFWVANIFCSEDKINLIDWDTTGWGYLGEDIASLIADEADIQHMVEIYNRCIPAYYRGFSEQADVVLNQEDNCIWEMIIFMFGYRLIEWYKFAKTEEEAQLQLDTLQKIYELKH